MGHVGFIFDGYQQEKFLKAKQFVKMMIRDLKPSINTVLASVFYLGDSTISSGMNDGNDRDKIVANLDRIKQTKDRRFRIVEGIEHARHHIFSPNNDKDNFIPKILILLTFDLYGNGTKETDVKSHEIKHIGSELRKSNIQVVAIGKNSKTSKDRLKDIAGSYDKVFLFKSIERLSENTFLEKICKTVQKVRILLLIF